MAGREHRAPGVYTERSKNRYSPILLGETGVPAFMGMTFRGPLDVPVRVDSFDEYKKLFGSPVSGSYLSDSIFGFFANGGQHCFVIRVAHKRGAKGKIATAASRQFKDEEGRSVLEVRAANEGEWGNQIKVTIEKPLDVTQTYLTFDMEKGSTEAVVKSARGFERGDLVRVYNKNAEYFAVLERVESKTLRFRDEDAIEEMLRSADLTYIEPISIDMTVTYLGETEVYRDLSPYPLADRFPERYVNEQSGLIQVSVSEDGRSMMERLPATVTDQELGGGADGIDGITPEDFIGSNEGPAHRVGLAALEANEEIDLVVVPDLMVCGEQGEGFNGSVDIEKVQQAVIAHCELMKDRFAILDVPSGLEIDEAVSWRLRFDSHFGAFYYPWIAVSGRKGNRLVPPAGHIAGVYSRCDRNNGVHQAAANEVIQGAVFLERSFEDEEIGYLNDHQLNPIRVLQSRGIRIWGARTVSSRKEWRYVPVRRVFNAVRRAIYLNTQWVVFETNSPKLWDKLRRQLNYFLDGLFKEGYFAGSKAEQGYYVKCDAETNPDERREAGQLMTEIGLAPVRPAEFITFTLEQQLPGAR